MTRLLWLTDRSEWHQRRALESAPPDIDVIMRRRPDEADLMALLPTIDFLISERSESVTAQMIAAAPNLKLILRHGSLIHDIDVAAATLAGVRVSMQPVLGTVYAAEHALLMILAVLKKLGRNLDAALRADHDLPPKRTDENTFAFNWLGFTDVGGLIGKTVAILGMGEIGVELTRRLIPFRPAAILYQKRRPYPTNVERELHLMYADLVTCLQNADVVVSLLPYAPETDRMLDAEVFSKMKPSAMLVHLGSGSVIDEPALITALQAGSLKGAALDTYEYEPLQPDHPLVAAARDPQLNLLLTPHTAGASLPPGRADDYAEITRFLRGEPLLYAVN
jgi:phosphoglycerate dehydrogenase-like enzyme